VLPAAADSASLPDLLALDERARGRARDLMRSLAR
jgi:hypothetical protein